LGQGLIAAPLGLVFPVDYPLHVHKLALLVQGRVVMYNMLLLFSYCCFEAAFLMPISLVKAYSVTVKARDKLK